MQYVLTFLEGIMTFISPCLLPMLPIYITYLSGAADDENKSKLMVKAFCFVFGFTSVFVSLGALAGTFGRFVTMHLSTVNLVGGLIVVLFGVNYLGLIKIPFLNDSRHMTAKHNGMNALSAFVMGLVFAIGWSPCVGAFLGSALMLAASSGKAVEGVSLLLVYSLGLSIPFLLTALLIRQLSSAFGWIKRHYKVINVVSGVFLIVLGTFMATGLLGRLLGWLSI